MSDPPSLSESAVLSACWLTQRAEGCRAVVPSHAPTTVLDGLTELLQAGLVTFVDDQERDCRVFLVDVSKLVGGTR